MTSLFEEIDLDDQKVLQIKYSALTSKINELENTSPIDEDTLNFLKEIKNSHQKLSEIVKENDLKKL